MSKTALLSELDALVDDLTVDAYDDEEQPAYRLVRQRGATTASP